jgi:hypothetical protein
LKNLQADLSRENSKLQATVIYLEQKLHHYGIVVNVNTSQFIILVYNVKIRIIIEIF